MTEKTSEVRQSYELISISQAEHPPGAEGSDWYSYVIAFGSNDNIHGYRQGNLNVVTEAVEGIVAQLNDRYKGKHGRAQIVAKPKKTPAPKDQPNLP